MIGHLTFVRNASSWCFRPEDEVAAAAVVGSPPGAQSSRVSLAPESSSVHTRTTVSRTTTPGHHLQSTGDRRKFQGTPQGLLAYKAQAFHTGIPYEQLCDRALCRSETICIDGVAEQDASPLCQLFLSLAITSRVGLSPTSFQRNDVHGYMTRNRADCAVQHPYVKMMTWFA